MIPDAVIEDIFDISYKASDVLIDHISDVLEDHGFVVGDVDNYDASIYIDFSLPGIDIADLDGQLIIRRMDKVFEVAANLLFPKKSSDSITYGGAVSDKFENIEKYLSMLKYDCLQYIEARCIESNSYKWHGLRFVTPA